MQGCGLTRPCQLLRNLPLRGELNGILFTIDTRPPSRCLFSQLAQKGFLHPPCLVVG